VEKKPASILIAPNAFQANPLSTITSKQTKNEPHSTASPAQFTTL